MRYLSGILALVGLAFHVRVYKIVSEPVVAKMIETLDRDTATVLDLFLIFATRWVPILFYTACFGFCFVRIRNRVSIGIGLAILAISVPYFAALFQLTDTSRIICLLAGGTAIYNHLTIAQSAPDEPFLDGSLTG